jgi:hypothetical protein
MNPNLDKYRLWLCEWEEYREKLFEELNFLKKQLGEIKEHMVDIDSLLTAEEKELVFRSFENEAKGKLVTLSRLEEL